MATHAQIHPQGSQRLQATVGAGLLNRYLLPKIALTVIGIASLAGVYLTMSTHAAPPAWALVRWLHLTAIGVLGGGAMWWGFFRRAPEHEDLLPVARLLVAQERRFRTIGGAAWLLAAATAFQLLWFYRWAVAANDLILWLLSVIALASALASTAWLLWPQSLEARAFQTGRAQLAWATLTLTLALAALLDARLTFPSQPWAWLLRPVHLVAFGLWFGGALWNIFNTVPAAQETLAIPVVIAAAEQLERFRRVVRVILPTLIITGLLQALPYTGYSATALVFSSFGQLILLKLGLVVALVAIFITCPLWRACSPIRGMCDLEDLETPEPALPQPSQRIDNRGRACAGFVHIQRRLDSMRTGEVLELLSTDRISWWELPVWLEKHGHTLLHREQSGRLWWKSYRFLIQKG